MASARIQCWALSLSAHRYSIRYKPGKHLCNADAFSRLPWPVTSTHEQFPEDLNVLTDHLSATSIGPANIREWTTKDPVLSIVRRFVMSGWPDQKLGEKFTPYTIRKV